MNQLKIDALLGVIVVCVLLGIGGISGYFVGKYIGLFNCKHGITNISQAYQEDVIRYEAKIAELGSLALEASGQWIECVNTCNKDIERYRSIALHCAEELEFFRPESTQVVDGVLLERSKSSQTASNDGVGIPFKQNPAK